jgi:hypothetical protein
MGGFKIMKTVLLAGAFLLSSSFLVAQNQSPASTPPTLPQSQSQPAPDQQPSSSPSSTMPSADQSAQAGSQSDSSAQKIEGCLSQTASGFALADASGTTYNLTGDTSKLSSHVGEQVEVKGTPASGSAASSAAPSADSSAASAGASGAASAAGQSFTVQSVKKIAKSCANAQPKQ